MRLPLHEIIVDMDADATRRFSSRVADYIRFRPSYPREIIPLLVRECALRPEARVADLGSGTGLLAALFLDYGCEVFGVEPNAEMRQAGERLLQKYPRFHSIDGRAEETTLPARSVDFVTAGQAFHWFDRERSRLEFRRISRLPGWVVLAWNERLVEGPFLEGYEALLQRYSTDYAKVDHRQVDDAAMDGFFGAGAWRLATFPNDQQFDLEGVLGRMNSSSYAPLKGSAEHDELNAAVSRLFQEHQQSAHVVFRHVTKVYFGDVSRK
jgi:SAM-dependent methyltransferase